MSCGTGEGVRRSTHFLNEEPYNACVRILISAGEASGEMYGAQLIEALRAHFGHVGTASTPVRRCGAPHQRTISSNSLGLVAKRCALPGAISLSMPKTFQS